MAGASSSVEELIAEGRYLAAAAIEEARGQKTAAEALFAQGRDFARAARLAAERQDLPAQLGHLLRGQEVGAATALLDGVLRSDAATRTSAAVLFEEHHVFAPAAVLRESLAELAHAKKLYERCGAWVELARLDEKAGHSERARQLYEHALEQLEATDPATALRARLGLGRLLLRNSGGNRREQEEAVRHLQAARTLAAAQAETELDEVELALAAALNSLGYEAVAREVMLERDRRIEKTRGRTPSSELPILERVRSYLDGLRPAEDLLLGRYQLRALFGGGGTGRAYRAWDVRSRGPVAIKLLPTASVEHPAYKRFVRELEILRRSPHPHRVEILDFDRQGGVLALPLLSQTLADVALPLPLSQLRRLLLEVLSGLAAAHALGVLHGGLKPQNILLTEAGTAKLSDFGAAYLQELLATQTESALSAFAYAAPEVLAGKPATVASDLYSLGVIAYLCATGQLPFRGPDFLQQHAEEPIPDPCSLRPELPTAWSALLYRMLEKNPQRRSALPLSEVEELVRNLPLPTARPNAISDGKTDLQPAETPTPGAHVGTQRAAPFLSIGTTPFSELFWGPDQELGERRGSGLGRSVVIERFHRAAQDHPAWPQHVEWLHQLAAQAGPGLQRVLGLELVGTAAPRAIYEAPPGALPLASPPEKIDAGTPLSAIEIALLQRVLVRLHAAGVTHGSVARAIHRGAAAEPYQTMLLVQAAGPLHAAEWPSLDGDRQALLTRIPRR